MKVTNRLVVIAQSLPGPMEPRLWILIQAFAHLLPPGDVIDAGANDGGRSLFSDEIGVSTYLPAKRT